MAYTGTVVGCFLNCSLPHQLAGCVECWWWCWLAAKVGRCCSAFIKWTNRWSAEPSVTQWCVSICVWRATIYLLTSSSNIKFTYSQWHRIATSGRVLCLPGDWRKQFSSQVFRYYIIAGLITLYCARKPTEK